ncbi:tetratricopeptide repeat-containing protein kinase family protein [Streptomyces wuyuanensis]|uniref:Tetratricopeptide repeat-containing protein n=1 Tax=Streptomyces wuyuanensis TaxID=1196353 RepID=A0A1G9ZUL3_9ACTN|nr:tetratricopeptide repeat-containing protein kinase family protein [Streptomyces wuyuanensis]SDN24910.1 Tetratricopeptide repeat-containing protein [Streptomyces wuyuanensis]
MWRELRGILGDSGIELAYDELLDALWLADRLPPGASSALACAAGSRPQSPAPPSGEGTAEPPGKAAHSGGAPPGAGPPPAGTNGTPDAGGGTVPRRPAGAPSGTGLHGAPDARGSGPLRSDASEGMSPRPAVPVRAPEARALASTELRLGRALRPLKQLRPDRRTDELDEPATVAAMAETGLPDVVLRPARTRWLDLALLVDDGVSMLLWQRLAAETRRLLERSGAFRDIRVYSLDSRSADAPVLGHHPFAPDSAPLPLTAVADPCGHTLLLAVSDGVGPAWRDGRMHRALERAAALGPTAVLHALPRRLWEGSGIRAEPWRVTTVRRGAANRTWRVADPVLPPELAPYSGVPVPVLAPDPDSVGAWARLVGSSGTSVVLPLLAPRAPARPYAATRSGGGDGLLRFRDAASPQAYRLAAHLAAVAPVSVPAMRLVQDAVGPDVDTGHLAEVFLGGLMRGADRPERDLLPQHRGFDFAEDARRILLDTVPPSDLVRATRAVTRRMAELVDGAAGFPAWLPHPSGPDTVAVGARPFGWVDARLLRRLGMPAPAAASPVGPGPAVARAANGTAPAADAPARTAAPARADAQPQPQEAPSPAGAPAPVLPSFVDRPGTDWVSRPPSEEPRSAGPYRLVARRVGGWPRIGLFLGTAGNHASYVLLRVPEALDRDTAVHLLTTEAEALIRLGAAHAPRLLGVSTRSGPGWLATECVTDPATGEPAATLRTFRARNGVLSPGRFLSVGRQFAAAMAQAHREDLVHGTLLPGSVLIAGDDVRVTGWMVASVDGEHSPHRARFLQPVEYEAPELTGSPEGPTRASDMYAVGALLLAAVTGEWGTSFSSTALPPLPGVPAEVSALLADCVAQDPSARPSADELLWAFDPATRPARPGLPAVPLGRDDEGRPVPLDVNGPEHGGIGPHGLVRGGTDAGRRAVLTGIVRRLAESGSPDTLTVVYAGHDGALPGSPLAALPHVVWCDTVGGRPARLRELTALLLKERGRRGTASRAAGLPRLLVVLDSFDRIAGTEESFFALADEVRALSGCAGVHVLVAQHTGRSPLVDLLDPSYTIELSAPRARLHHGGGPPVAFSPAPFGGGPARGWDHDERHARGVTLLREGRAELALRMLGDAVTARKESLGAEHEATLASRHEHASALLALGRNAEALDAYRHVARDRARVFGSDHTGTLDARQQAARALGLLGRHSEALSQYLEVLSKRERVQGGTHEDTMRCRHDLASTLGAMGRLSEAYRVARETWRARTEVLGPLHADTLVTLRELAHTTARLERWEEAAELFGTVAAGWTRTLGAGHADTVAAVRDAASARARAGGP